MIKIQKDIALKAIKVFIHTFNINCNSTISLFFNSEKAFHIIKAVLSTSEYVYSILQISVLGKRCIIVPALFLTSLGTLNAKFLQF